MKPGPWLPPDSGGRGGSDENGDETNCNSRGDRNHWPCANCHATVNNQEAKCPYCGGIQVKIPRSPNLMTKTMIHSKALLERLAPTPMTPKTMRDIDGRKVLAFLNETATSSTMDYEENEEEEGHEKGKAEQRDNTKKMGREKEINYNDRPESSLSHTSVASNNSNCSSSSQLQKRRPQSRQSLMHSPPPIFAPSPAPSNESDQITAITSIHNAPLYYVDDDGHYSSYNRQRPPDPVALTLEATPLRRGTPSPQMVLEQQQQLQKQNRRLTKKQESGMPTDLRRTGSPLTSKRKAKTTTTTATAGSSGSGFFETPKKKMFL